MALAVETPAAQNTGFVADDSETMKKTYIMTVLFLLLIAFSVSSNNCPDFADSEEKFLHVLRLALQDMFEKGMKDKDYSEEIKDLMSFYAATKDWDEADCSVKGKQTGKAIKEILEDVYGRISDVEILKCEDGVEYGRCSSKKPEYCFSGKTVDKCSVCGCPNGLVCHKDECKTVEEIEKCEDGTTKPTDTMNIDKSITFCEGEYNLTQGITIAGKEININCNGAVLNGNGAGVGLTVTGSYISIKNCKITNYEMGILLEKASNMAVESNELRNNVRGIYVSSSNNNEFKNNILAFSVNNNLYLTKSSNNIILGNKFYGSEIFDDNQAKNVYCREGIQNDYYADAKGPKCELTNCGNNVCDEDENCFNCADCACKKGEMCTNWVCKRTTVKPLSRLQREACDSAEGGKTCDRLEKLGIVTPEMCCIGLGKCCQ